MSRETGIDEERDKLRQETQVSLWQDRKKPFRDTQMCLMLLKSLQNTGEVYFTLHLGDAFI